MEVHCLKHYEPGTKVGLNVIPDNIHIIPYDEQLNHYDAVMGEFDETLGIAVKFADIETTVDYKKLYPQAQIKDGALADKDGNAIETAGVKIVAFYEPEDAIMSDNVNEGIVSGKIISFYYIGDHYSYTIRSNSEEDYVVSDEYLWNQGDMVSIKIPEDKINYKLVQA